RRSHQLSHCKQYARCQCAGCHPCKTFPGAAPGRAIGTPWWLWPAGRCAQPQQQFRRLAMKRVSISERANWRAYAEEVGFHFHTFDGEAYWDESAYYEFTLQQIEEDLEAPTEELHQMVMDMVGDITRSEEMLTQLDIPRDFWSYIWNSWKQGEPHLYGRMDLVYQGIGNAKLLELNYDTPTSLFETGFFQWVWLEDQIKHGALPAHADQFNSLHDKLEQAFTQ